MQEYGQCIIDRQPPPKSYLIINIPPGSTKSTICTQYFPLWLWINDPTLITIALSYSSALSLRHAIRSRDVFRSNEFKELFPDIVTKDDQDAVGSYANTKGGQRISSSIGGTILGDHAHCVPYNQKLKTENGLIPIGEIVDNKLGVKVLSYNHLTKQMEFKSIEKYSKSPKSQLIEIETKSGKKLICTEGHPIYVENKGYICASKLHEDDIIITDKWNEYAM